MIDPGVIVKQGKGMSENRSVIEDQILFIERRLHSAPHAGGRDQDNDAHEAPVGLSRKQKTAAQAARNISVVWFRFISPSYQKVISKPQKSR
jgi:hypothetical protein